MMKNSPWDRLSIGDAKRVDSSGHFDFFWILLEDHTPGMYLKLSAKQQLLEPVPKLRSIDASYRIVGDRQAFVIALRERPLLELFETLCKSLADAGEQGRDADDALARTLQRTRRWHHLLRGGSSGALSPEEQKGLVAELAFLRELTTAKGPDVAIAAWKGPEGAAKDFELPNACIEIKARRAAAKPDVPISSAEQLANVSDARVFLRVTDVVSTAEPDAMTLHDHVRLTSTELEISIAAIIRFEELLQEAGYDVLHDYSTYAWSVGSSRDFEVVEGFPRIVPPLPKGVSNVRYAIGLEACAPFSTDSRLIDILRGDGS